MTLIYPCKNSEFFPMPCASGCSLTTFWEVGSQLETYVLQRSCETTHRVVDMGFGVSLDRTWSALKLMKSLDSSFQNRVVLVVAMGLAERRFKGDAGQANPFVSNPPGLFKPPETTRGNLFRENFHPARPATVARDFLVAFHPLKTG